MNDPHVVCLLYRVQRDSGTPYSPAEPFEHETESFSLRLEAGEARFTMKGHFAKIAEATAVVDSFIREWEFEATLKAQPHAFKFTCDHWHIVDRNPILDSPSSLSVSAGFHGDLLGTLSAGVDLGPLSPLPPTWNITLTPDVSSLYQRYCGYRDGREPLTSMAYFCLTVLEASASPVKRESPRRAAARQYRVAFDVLKRIGKLTAEKGGSQARKAAGLGYELTNVESRFLEDAVKAILRRAAEVAREPLSSHDEIRLCDLLPK